MDVEIPVSSEEKFSRRKLLKRPIAGAGLACASGLLLRSGQTNDAVQVLRDAIDGGKNVFPEEYFSDALERLSGDEVASLISGTRRENSVLSFQEPSVPGVLAEASVSVPAARVLELSLDGIRSDSPSAHVIEVNALGEEQRRFATIISSPEPKSTNLLVGPFTDDEITLRFIRRADTSDPIVGGQLKGSISFIDDETSAEREIMESVPEVIPRFEHRYNLANEALYKSYVVVYRVGDRLGYLNYSRFLWEGGGTEAKKLYFDTKADEDIPGRTDDVEWTTMSLVKPEFPVRIYYQLPHHNPFPYTGVLLDNRRPIVETFSDNNNFIMGTRNKLKEGSFSNVPEIISADEFDEVENSPDRWAQLLSFRGLILDRQLRVASEPILDFVSHYPDLASFPLE